MMRTHSGAPIGLLTAGSAFALACAVAFTAACGNPANEPAAVTAPPPPTLYDGALTAAERDEFYHLAEGSEILPVHWFFALENETGSGLFATNLERFGLIPDAASPANPYGLPVGITSAETRDLRFTGVQMIGVTCAACHVSEVTHQGKRVRLDGGPSHADVEAFAMGITRAITSTIESPLKLLRFIDRLRDRTPSEVLAEAEAKRAAQVYQAIPDVSAADRLSTYDKQLHDGVRTLLERERGRPAIDLKANRPIKPGPHVAAAAKNVRSQLTAGLDTAALSAHTPSAPPDGSVVAAAVPREGLIASIHAFFSDAVVTLRLLKARLGLRTEMSALMHEHTTTPGFGRIDAFGGFRLMLFGETPIAAPVSFPDVWSLAQTEWLHWDANTTSVLERNIGQALGMGAVLDKSTYSSTVNLVNLNRLEQLALKTRPPSWEKIIAPIDRAAADRGAALFKTHCESCHALGGSRSAMPALTEVGTDPNRAQSFAQPIGSQPFDVALGTLLNRVKLQTAQDIGITADQQKAMEGRRAAQWRTTGRYPARPLTGIWASAPYLHNGSVPTLHDLLLPPAERPVTFYVGSVEYDAAKLGFVSTEQPGMFLFDTRLPGNGNGGHTYGTQLSPAERASLLEYLKQR